MFLPEALQTSGLRSQNYRVHMITGKLSFLTQIVTVKSFFYLIMTTDRQIQHAHKSTWDVKVVDKFFKNWFFNTSVSVTDLQEKMALAFLLSSSEFPKQAVSLSYQWFKNYLPSNLRLTPLILTLKKLLLQWVELNFGLIKTSGFSLRSSKIFKCQIYMFSVDVWYFNTLIWALLAHKNYISVLQYINIFPRLNTKRCPQAYSVTF